MANGVADNMLITSYLSARSQVFVAPAMDLDMMSHPSTTCNIDKLRSYGNIIIEPAAGELASHLVGKGRMEEPENIFKILEDYFRRHATLTGKKVLVTAGPTYEKIDPVRFIGNYSSGKMGYAIAEEAAARGAHVTLVSGPVAIKTTNPDIEVINVESAKEMLEACRQHFDDTDIAIMTAAVADYAPAECAEVKIKREKREDTPVLKLVKNPDIAATLGAMKRNDQTMVGFALETDNEQANAEDKLQRKNLDYIVLNSLREPGTCFGTDNNKVSIFSRDGHRSDFGIKPKSAVAADILDIITSDNIQSLKSE